MRLLYELAHRTIEGLRAVTAFALLVAFVLCSMPPAFAQVLTGSIQGTVTASQGNTKLAGVKVTANAPSGSATATSDSNGFFSINGLTPDTYAVTFTLGGYETLTVQGITVVQGQAANVTTALNKTLQRIGRTQSRSTAGAFQPTQTTDQYNVNAQQITTTLGKQGGNNEANLLASIPGASFDSSGYPVLRGGREYEEGFQYEGIDYTDAFTHQFVNSLILNGASNFQVQPGAGDASIGNAGTGAINVVAKRGTRPAFGQLEANLRAGYFQHESRGEYGWASLNGHFSEYASVDLSRDARVYGNGQDPLLIGVYFTGRSYQWINDIVNNFVYKFGKDNSQSLQAFYNNTQFDLHLGRGVPPGGLPYKSTDNWFLFNQRLFTGLTTAQIQAVMPFTYGQRFLGDRIGAAGDGRQVINYNQPNETMKLQYSNNLDPSTFVTVKAYRVNSVTLFDFPFYTTAAAVLADFSSLQGGFHDGVALDGTKQLGSKNLLGFGGKFDYLRPVYSQPSAGNALSTFSGLFGNTNETADFFHSSNCPYGPNTTTYIPGTSTCGYITQYFTPYQLTCRPSPGVVCGAGPMPLAVQLPYADEGTHTTRHDWAIYVKDTYSPTDRLKVDVGLRLDGANWHYPACDIKWCAPTSFTTNAAGTVPTGFQFNYDTDTRQPRVLQPRLAVAFQASRNDALRLSYGRSVQFPAIAQVDNTGFEGTYGAFRGIPSHDPGTGTTAQFCSVAAQIGGTVSNFNAPCSDYADQLYWENQAFLGIPIAPLKPVTFTNWDFSYSHLFPHQVSVKLTPFYNRSFNQIASTAQQLVKNGVPLTTPTGTPILGPSINSNLGQSHIMGVEFLLTKEAAYGLSGSLSLTYQNEFSNVVPTSPSEDFYPTIPPASLALGNLYRVGFLSPFVGALAIQEKTHSGWRINPVIYYNHGYPISPGLITANYVNGKPYNLPNTNITNSSQLGAAGGADRYVDPRNPGSLFNPNIAATRGTPDQNAAGGILSAARFAPVQLTIEYQSPRNPRSTFGAVVFNVFNQIYGQPALNRSYQPIATGIAGPYSGYSAFASQVNPLNYGITNVYPFRRGNMPYTITPNGIGRTVQFYYQMNL